MRVRLVCALCVALGVALAPVSALAVPIFAPAPFIAPLPAPVQTASAYPVRHNIGAISQQALDAMQPRESVSVQLREEAEPVLLPPDMTVPREHSRAELCSTIASVALSYALPISFFTNLIQQESTFRWHVVSHAGAQGIAQFMPRTAKAYGLDNPFDPIHALSVSALFLSELYAQFGNLGMAAAAYNAGPRRVQDFIRKGSSLPEETQNYVRSITGRSVAEWKGAKDYSAFEMPTKAGCPLLFPIEPSAVADADTDVEEEQVASVSATSAN